MRRFAAVIIAINLLVLAALPYTARAYWVWTPETKKFINPKYAVKDTPKEQYDWAMDFYNSKNYQRSAVEFEKLVKNYEYSEYAARAQYHAGLSYDNLGKYYIAFQNYQKAIDNFPHVNNMDEIIAREFNIGNLYAAKSSPKVLGTDIMTSFDRSIEIYKKVVDNAPFGKLADESQFKMAMTMKQAGRYDEATVAFQKLLDDYPDSKLYEQARYEMANSAYRASLSPAYDAAPTDKALKAFEEFAGTNADEKLTQEAQATIKRLKDKAAEKSFQTAEFYEQQKHYVSAIIYYKDVIDKYPDSSSAKIAATRIGDLKTGNYSHKSAAELSAQKKGWLPWSGKEKKKGGKIVVKEATPASTAPALSALAEEKAEEVAAVPAAAVVEEKSAQDQEIENKEAPVEVEKAPAKKSWWLLDFGKKPEKPCKVKSKKAWAPLNFDKKEAKAKEDITEESVKPAEEVKSSAKKGWWLFPSGKKSDKPAEAKPKKAWAPLSFDKKAPGIKEGIEGSAKPEEVAVKPSANKRWWSYGLREKSKVDKASDKKGWWLFGSGKKSEKPDEIKPKKAWAPLNFDKKEEGIKKDE